MPNLEKLQVTKFIPSDKTQILLGMPVHVICFKYKVKDVLKGWAYTGVFPFGETGMDNDDTEEEIKRKVASIIIKKSIIFTQSLFLVLTIGSPRSIGLVPYERNLIKNGGSVYKINIAEHLGLAHYVVAGTTFILESLDVALFDKDDYILLTPHK